MEILSNWETFLVAKVAWWPWSIMECMRPTRRLLELWCHVETRGAAQAEAEPGAKFTRNRPTSVVTNTHWPCGGQRSQLRQLFWLLAAGDGIIRNRWEKTDLPHQHLSVHPGMQPGKAEASTAREWKRSLPFLGRVEVKDVRWSKIELPQVLSCGGKNDLINYVKQQLYRQNQLFQFTNKN